MNKLSKILFTIVACVMPIFIGLAHTAVHFRQLVSPEIQEYLQKEFIYSGKSQPLWYNWGIVSFMMGASFIVIGLLNISMLNKLSKAKPLPILPIIAMIIFQLCVTYVGYEYEQSFQLYGGIVGFAIMFICLILTFKNKQ